MREAKTLKVVVVLLLMAMLFIAIPAAAQEGSAPGEFTLTILHTNDVHGRVDEFDAGGNTCDEEEQAEAACFGGAARRQTVINQVKAEAPNAILLDAGDQFQGTLFYNQYKGAEAQEMMNLLGYQAMAVGNHEFDDGPGNLGSFIRGVKFPVLSANIDASAEPELAGLILPYTVLDVNGEKVGVIGFTTEETGILSRPGPNVKFNNTEESVQKAVDELTAQGVNKIIGLSHAGIGRDREIAAAVTGLDVIVGGHTHTYLSNTDEKAEGPYPVVVDGPDGSPVLIVTDATQAKSLGRLDVTFDANGVAASHTGNPILLDNSVAKDEAVQARVEALAGPVKALMENVVGSAAVDLDGERASCRFGECNMGNLVADAMLWKTAGQGIQMAITNGGGIRASIPAGDVTVGDVLTVLPFGNLIATADLTGADVVEALENGVSRAENPENEGTGRFPQVSGLKFTWDPNQPVGSRVSNVEVKGADGSFSPIDLAATYKVATLDFMRQGGDGYETFVNATNAYDFGDSLDQAVQAYIKLNSPVAPAVEGRITQGEGEAMAESAAPAEAAPAEAAGESVATCQDYTVQADDWLSKIAEKNLGDVLAYTTIVDATNAAAAQSAKYAAIADPNVIEVGQVVCIPAAQ
jgi:5'-nucleotidase